MLKTTIEESTFDRQSLSLNYVATFVEHVRSYFIHESKFEKVEGLSKQFVCWIFNKLVIINVNVQTKVRYIK